ncbi:MAG: hypothetical protein QF415_08145 [Candidatus Undinarchaeales archaeon]|jgi:hypothetical protein|nr:hypothetical protein [Candidatus Undinarchaeales archaeon]MDP7493532.1 hypothetical protein [Candidatus Undinarchaeales archaeon]
MHEVSKVARAWPVVLTVVALILTLVAADSVLVECEDLQGRELDHCVRDAIATIPLNLSKEMLGSCVTVQDEYLRAECTAIVAYRLLPHNASRALDACNSIKSEAHRSACLGLIAARRAENDPAVVAQESARLPSDEARIWLVALLRDYTDRHGAAKGLELCATFAPKLQRYCVDLSVSWLNTSHANLCEGIQYSDIKRQCQARTSGDLLAESQADGTTFAVFVLLIVSVGTLGIMHIEVKHYS